MLENGGQNSHSGLGFAIVGCGRIASRHADLLSKGMVHGARLVAVCDVDLMKARAFGEKYQVPFFESFDEMLTEMDSTIQVVSILTPSGLHAEHSIAVAKYKKHVVVEKPMALRLSDADAMIQACHQAGVRLFVVKQNRYNLPIVQLREAVDQKRFGKLLLGTVRVRWCRTQDYYDQAAWRGTWKFDGGVFANQASHHIDVLEWMMGEVESVFAKSATFLADIEAEDTGIALLKFTSGAFGIIEATTATRPKDLEGSVSILGEKGTVEVGGFALNIMKTWNFCNPSFEDPNILSTSRENPPNVYGFGHQQYLKQVVRCIQSGDPALVDGFEGRKSLEVINALYQSIETGKEVFLKKDLRQSRLGVGSDAVPPRPFYGATL